MYLMYVDESGDDGAEGTPALILAGVVVAETRLAAVETKARDLVKSLCKEFGLKTGAELRASALLHGKTDANLPLERRVAVLRAALKGFAAIEGMKVLITRVRKRDQPFDVDLFRTAWEHHLRNFEAFLAPRKRSWGASRVNRGIVFFDLNKEKQLLKLFDRLRADKGRSWTAQKTGWPWSRRTIIVESEADPISHVIERPVARRAADTLLLQAADLFAYAVYQSDNPNALMKKHAPDGFMKDIRKALLGEIRDVRPPDGSRKNEPVSKPERGRARDHRGRRDPVLS